MIATQNLVVLVIVGAAGVYLAYRAWGVVAAKRGGGCGTCGSCGADDEKQKQLVTLDPHVDDSPRS